MAIHCTISLFLSFSFSLSSLIATAQIDFWYPSLQMYFTYMELPATAALRLNVLITPGEMVDKQVSTTTQFTITGILKNGLSNSKLAGADVQIGFYDSTGLAHFTAGRSTSSGAFELQKVTPASSEGCREANILKVDLKGYETTWALVCILAQQNLGDILVYPLPD
eukprot:m.45202 g.45202  ORF g.45202 m.45202 type:complete len:166 (+) comp47201_c1_seq2:407-904(+)